MASINILNIVPKNTITKFNDPYVFEVVFEVLTELKNDIEWKMIYIGSAEDEKYDQILETIEINVSSKIGTMKFEFSGDAPEICKIPENDLLGVTAILLCCTYNGQEFFRCGYYLNVLYDNDEMNYNPPEKIDTSHLIRSILAEKPRITKYDIDWDNENVQKSKNDNTGLFMFNEGKMNKEKFKSLQEEKNNNPFVSNK